MGQQKKATTKTYPLRISANALQNIDEITGYLAFINKNIPPDCLPFLAYNLQDYQFRRYYSGHHTQVAQTCTAKSTQKN
jgi:hypothetical protein